MREKWNNGNVGQDRGEQGGQAKRSDSGNGSAAFGVFFCGGQRKMQYAVWRRNVLRCMICWGKGNECCKPR